MSGHLRPGRYPALVPTALAGAVALVALLAAVTAIVLASVANRRWARRGSQRGPASSRSADPRLASLPDDVVALREQLDHLRGVVAGLSGALGAAREADAAALRHVAVVRYDAFADVGGRLSHSVAILDDTATGVVLTTLSGKSDVRTYVRAVTAGEGDGSLTAEEQQAVEAAVGRR